MKERAEEIPMLCIWHIYKLSIRIPIWKFLSMPFKKKCYLSLPFHSVYFNNNSDHQKTLPDNRFKLPIGVRANYFLGVKVTLWTYYKYYTDDWDLKSNTISLETPVKISTFVSLSPLYIYYS